MKFGVDILNFGPGANPGNLRRWAQVAEGLGYDFVMISDHVAISR
jgi:alkanesulfonate monooxygenase SsuD/methylene tetrahydromethanopterin reductase-like flavin-dependent oxidoreductase (luciferase family)